MYIKIFAFLKLKFLIFLFFILYTILYIKNINFYFPIFLIKYRKIGALIGINIIYDRTEFFGIRTKKQKLILRRFQWSNQNISCRIFLFLHNFLLFYQKIYLNLLI